MRLSKFFLPILRDNPKEAEILSHRLMLRAGMIRQEAAGIYAWLPLGFRVLQKIEQIVREEMDRAGAVEMLMPTLQLADLWRESGRYDAYGPEMLRITDRHKREMLYGPTNEEMITEIFRAGVKSYRELPKNLYHVQWKFRDEQRPRFGVMRGREFLMKDAYSFDVDEAGARLSYNRMFVAYLRIFARMGLVGIPMRAETGPIGGDLSHEFIVLAETGESGVYINRDVLDLPIPPETVDYESDLSGIVTQWTSLYAATEDVHDAARFEAETPAAKRVHTRGIEVGQVFYFGDKYTKAMKALVTGPDGVERPAQCGSYGVGVSRLAGAIIEASHDDAGIIWPEAVAPYLIGLANLKVGDAATDAACRKVYEALSTAGVEVLYDDTNARPGEKFARLDLIGLPFQLLVGPKNLAEGKIELRSRANKQVDFITVDDAIRRFYPKYTGRPGPVAIGVFRLPINVSDYFDVRAEAARIGIPDLGMLAVIPPNLRDAESLADLKFLSESATFYTLFKQNNIGITRFDIGSARPRYVQNNSLSWMAPTLFVAASMISENQNLISIVLSIIANYATDFLRGNKTNNRIKLHFVVEKTDGKTFKSVNYEGPIDGVVSLSELLKDISNG